jgi:hypothetical protein
VNAYRQPFGVRMARLTYYFSSLLLKEITMTIVRIASLSLALSLAAVAPAVSQNLQQNRPLSNTRDLISLLKHTPGHATLPAAGNEAADSARNAVAMGLAKSKTYQFASADYPGAGESLVFDRNISTTVGAFVFSSLAMPFTLKGGSYEILNVPGSIAALIGGINANGEMVGGYGDLSNNVHGFIDNAGSFTSFDFPGGSDTIAYEVNISGEIVGQYVDASNNEHGFLNNAGVFTSIDFPGSTTGTTTTGIDSAGDIVGSWVNSTGISTGFLLSGGVFTPLNYPLATSTTAWGINDYGEISGSFTDASSVMHGFIYASGKWSQVDVAGATATSLSQIKNNHSVTGDYVDSLMETHGLTGH